MRALKMIFVVTACLAAALIAPSGATAASAKTHVCDGSYHAGVPVGDGEYTDGSILSATRISCAHALKLVKPAYKHVLAVERAGSKHVRVGHYSCKIIFKLQRQQKNCSYHKKRFAFV